MTTVDWSAVVIARDLLILNINYATHYTSLRSSEIAPHITLAAGLAVLSASPTPTEAKGLRGVAEILEQLALAAEDPQHRLRWIIEDWRKSKNFEPPQPARTDVQ